MGFHPQGQGAGPGVLGDFLAPCGLDRRFIEFDAVYFDGFNEVGIVADKTKHAHWKNVAFGENNPAAP